MQFGLMEGLALGSTVLNTIAAKRQRAILEARRNEALRNARAANDSRRTAMMRGNYSALMNAAGRGADAVGAVTRGSADALAQAGITNSGITAQAGLQAQDQANQALAGMANTQNQQALDASYGWDQNLAQMEMGNLNSDLAAARAGEGSAAAGVGDLFKVLGAMLPNKGASAAKKPGAPAASPAPALNLPGAPSKMGGSLDLGTAPSLAGPQRGIGWTAPSSPLSLAGSSGQNAYYGAGGALMRATPRVNGLGGGYQPYMPKLPGRAMFVRRGL